MLYSEKVMDHFRNPRNLGTIENADAVGEVGNAKCGDIMKMYLKIDNGIITDVKFNTFGCGSAIATSSMATEMIRVSRLKRRLSFPIRLLWRRLTAFRHIKYTVRFWLKRRLRRRCLTITASTPNLQSPKDCPIARNAQAAAVRAVDQII